MTAEDVKGLLREAGIPEVFDVIVVLVREVPCLGCARIHVRVHLTQKFIIGVGSTVVSQLFGRSVITEND